MKWEAALDRAAQGVHSPVIRGFKPDGNSTEDSRTGAAKQPGRPVRSSRGASNEEEEKSSCSGSVRHGGGCCLSQAELSCCLGCAYVHEMDLMEIAAHTGLSAIQVKGHLQYARGLLRKELFKQE